jgi:hypothetical protein
MLNETELFFDAHLPQSLWEEAAQTAIYLLNQLPSRAIDMERPFQKLTGMVPNLTQLQICGCAVYILLKKPVDKLSPKAISAIFFGYDAQSKTYRCYDYQRHKILIGQNVRFDESSFGFEARECDPILDDAFDCLLPDYSDPAQDGPKVIDPPTSAPDADSIPPHTLNIVPPVLEEPWFSDTPAEAPAPSVTPPEPLALNNIPILPSDSPVNCQCKRDLTPPRDAVLPGQRRLCQPSTRLKDYYVFAATQEAELECCNDELTMYNEAPLTFAHVVLLPEWVESMADEIQSIEKNKTWKLVHIPCGTSVISCKWLFKVKEADTPVRR